MAVTDEATLKIKDMILGGQLKPGDRLPPEKLLSESLGLSRSSLREAVKALEVIHVLDVRRVDGTYVTSLEPKLLLEAMVFVVDIHQDSSVLEPFEARRILEPAAAALAAANATPEDIERLREMLGEVGENTSIDGLVAHDMLFHHHISTVSGNAYLAGLLDGLSSSTLRARVVAGAHPGSLRAAHPRRAPRHRGCAGLRRRRTGPVPGDRAHQRRRARAAPGRRLTPGGCPGLTDHGVVAARPPHPPFRAGERARPRVYS